MESQGGSSVKKRSFWRRYLRKPKPTYWAVLLRESGSLEILALPDFTLKFVALNFHLGEISTIDNVKPKNHV